MSGAPIGAGHWRWTILLVALTHASAGAVPPAALLDATSSEPRAFGYLVGDVVARTVTVHVPDGLALDESSVPKPGARG
jgi:mxaA protein